MQTIPNFLPALSPDQARPLLAALAAGVIGPGPLPALLSFESAGPAAQTAATLAQALSDGLDFATALERCQPALPEALSEILALGAQQGRLDEYLTDILTELDSANTPVQALLRLDQLQQRLLARPDSPLICVGCLERELAKIIRRAQTEQASSVILEQEGERYFHQKYIAAKLVRISEASHSKTFHTLATEMARWAQRPDSLTLEGQAYAVSLTSPNCYVLTGPNHFSLSLEFRA